jgi:hypothetical protein
VIVVVALVASPGPFELVTVPNTELTFNRGIKVPSLHELTVSVKLVPDSALTENEQLAVPAFSKSEDCMPVTF